MTILRKKELTPIKKVATTRKQVRMMTRRERMKGSTMALIAKHPSLAISRA
jgi:hypothetical protein